jgi:hypothetical protein
MCEKEPPVYKIWLSDDQECVAYVAIDSGWNHTGDASIKYDIGGKHYYSSVAVDISIHDGEDAIVLGNDMKCLKDAEDSLEAIKRIRRVLDDAEEFIRRTFSIGSRTPMF